MYEKENTKTSPTILRKINQEVEDYKNKLTHLVPGLTHNQYDIIEAIFFYYNSRFKSGDVDEDGDRKYFENINKNPCKVCTKAIDFDTKNFRLLTAGGGDPLKTWFMERDLKYWMRSKQFGKTLNRIFKELPIFGTVVLKVIEGTPYFVDLRNFIVEQSAETLESSAFIIEVHNYSVPEFRAIAKQMKWDQEKVDKVIELFHQMKDTSHIRIYERYGEVCEDYGNGEEYEYKRVFIADVGVDEVDNYGRLTVKHTGVELASEKWEGNPYWEFHMEKMAGRWLGIGVVETLFEPQIRINELANLQTKTSYWSALRLFYSQDPAMSGNLATERKNGDVIVGDAPITQIDMSDRNLAFFNQDHQKWMQNRAELTFSYDVVQGERLPAGTPLGSAQLAVSQTLSYFEGIQENVAMDLKEMFYEAIIPSFEKEMTAEHTMRLVGKDLDAYIAMVKNDLVLKEVIRLAVDSVTSDIPFPTNSTRDAIGLAIEETIKQGKEKILTVPKNFYKDLKYDFDIDITGESVDTKVRYATRFAILQAITSDPTMTTDPVKKKILYGMAEDGGLNPADLFDITETKTAEQLVPGRAGGGVSAPVQGAKIPGQEMTTV